MNSAFGVSVQYAIDEDDTHFVGVLLPPKPLGLLEELTVNLQLHIDRCYTFNGLEPD